MKTRMCSGRVVYVVAGAIALAASAAAPRTAFADGSDCSLSEEVLRSQVDARRLPKGARLVDSGRVGTSFHETVVFADGVRVTIGIGGCAHLGLDLDVRDERRITATISVASAMPLLLAMLARLPAKKGATLRPADFIEALRRVKPDSTKFPVSLDCGKYVTCDLMFEDNPPRLRLSYDFPL